MKLVAALAFLIASLASWQAAAQRVSDTKVDPRIIAAQIDYKNGPQSLGEVAEVRAESLSFLTPADARRLLVELWENPPQSAQDVLGVLVPKGFDPFDPAGWAIVVRYEKTGYVSDSDADKIDYDELLQQMQSDTREASAERVKQGYPGIALVGWASKPFYDKATHKLHWAKQLHFQGEKDDTLNYNLRVLGRQGVMELNFIAGMEQLADIRAAIPRVMAEVDFKPGYRYQEFDSSVDEVAGYGLAALIAGGVLKKAGLFGVILGVLVAAKKFLVVGVMAVVGGIVAFFRRRRARRPLS